MKFYTAIRKSLQSRPNVAVRAGQIAQETDGKTLAARRRECRR
jgi:hypothetical protein